MAKAPPKKQPKKQKPREIDDSSESSLPPPAKPLTWIQAITRGDDERAKEAISEEIKRIIDKYNLDKYSILFLYDDVDDISDFHSDRLYAASRSDVRDDHKILLIVHSRGGEY